MRLIPLAHFQELVAQKDAAVAALEERPRGRPSVILRLVERGGL